MCDPGPQALLGVYYVAASFAYIVSIVAPPGLAQLVGVVTIFSNSMFAGGAPVLKQLLTVGSPTAALCCDFLRLLILFVERAVLAAVPTAEVVPSHFFR